MTSLESQRRQDDLVDVARRSGFTDIQVIDDDLGRSASGTVARPGFDRLVAWLCAGKVLLSMTADQIHVPRPSDEGRMTSFTWMPIRYRNVIAVLKNPFYAGVYVYGKSQKRTSIVNGRTRRSYGHGKPAGT